VRADVNQSGDLDELRAVRLDDEERLPGPLARGDLPDAATAAALPPRLRTPDDRVSVSPPTVSNTASASRGTPSNRVARQPNPHVGPAPEPLRGVGVRDSTRRQNP
jgi:hypothetical protein